MNRTKTFAMAAVGIGMAVPTFAGDALSDFKAFLKAEEPKVEKAFATENIGYFTSTTTPDFTMTEKGKTTNKKESLKDLKMFFDMASNIKVTFKMSKVMVSGSQGSADTEGHFTCDVPGPDKKTHKMTMHEWATETWRKSGNTWKLAKIASTRPAITTMDGKKVDMATMAPPPKPPMKGKGG